MSWVRSKFKVTTWVQHPIDSHPFGSMSIHPLIPMIELFFQNLTFKIQGQSHSSRSHTKYNILSTRIPFIPYWSALPFLRYSYFWNWPWKSKVKVMGEVKVQSDNVSLTSYRLTSLWFHVNRPSHSLDTAFSRFQGHKVGITPYRPTSLSFHVNRPSHSWDKAISKFDVENSRSRSCVRSKLKVTTWVRDLVDSHPFRSMSIGHPIPEIRLFSKFDLENQWSMSWVRSQFKITMWV